MPTTSAKLALALLDLEPADLTMTEDRSAPVGLIPPCDCTACCTCGYCVCNCGNRAEVLVEGLDG
ncbi:hypothetical protein ACFWF7_03595 [Nocardia sp. NPDC060256]|uniref:hypothetical protein n=1 Tax=unclassified Nocardia TaxID=2637762 RepID=UPI00364E6EEB